MKILRNFVPLKKGLILNQFNEQRLTRFTSRILVTMIRRHGDNCSLADNAIGEIAANDKTQTIDSLNNFRENYFSSNKMNFN